MIRRFWHPSQLNGELCDIAPLVRRPAAGHPVAFGIHKITSSGQAAGYVSFRLTETPSRIGRMVV